MVNEFEEGKRYKFSKRLFRENENTITLGWDDDIDGLEVVVEDSKFGHCETSDGYVYAVKSKWCEEINDDDIIEVYKNGELIFESQGKIDYTIQQTNINNYRSLSGEVYNDNIEEFKVQIEKGEDR